MVSYSKVFSGGNILGFQFLNIYVTPTNETGLDVLCSSVLFYCGPVL